MISTTDRQSLSPLLSAGGEAREVIQGGLEGSLKLQQDRALIIGLDVARFVAQQFLISLNPLSQGGGVVAYIFLVQPTQIQVSTREPRDALNRFNEVGLCCPVVALLSLHDTQEVIESHLS